MNGLDAASVCVKVWDVYLEAGMQYEFFFYQWGQKAPHLALFRNPGTGPYWAHRGASEWEMSGSGTQTIRRRRRTGTGSWFSLTQERRA